MNGSEGACENPFQKFYNIQCIISLKSNHGTSNTSIICWFSADIMAAMLAPDVQKLGISSGEIGLHQICSRETNCNSQWIVIYRVDSAIHLFEQLAPGGKEEKCFPLWQLFSLKILGKTSYCFVHQRGCIVKVVIDIFWYTCLHMY